MNINFYSYRAGNPRQGLRIFLLIITVLAILNPLIWGQKKMVSRYANIDFGKDSRGFNSAKEMYDTAALKAFDREAELLIAKMNKLMKNKYLTLEAKTVRAVLEDLNPYRQSPEIQEAAQTWKSQFVSSVKAGKYRKPGADAKTMFKTANNYYNKIGKVPQTNRENLKLAIQNYLKLLIKYPNHWDCRNNLALSELHRGQDLIAQLELEILSEISPGYAPALVNLTVLYERMGKSRQGEALAYEVQQKHPQLPQAVYNAAWYYNWVGNFNRAKDLLMPLVSMDASAKVKRLDNFNTRQMGSKDTSGKVTAQKKTDDEKTFWQKGIAGSLGGKSVWWAWILSIAVFLFLSFIGAAIWAGMAQAATKKNEAPFISTVIAGGFGYILFWGAPTGWWWIPLVIYVILFFAVAADTIKNIK